MLTFKARLNRNLIPRILNLMVQFLFCIFMEFIALRLIFGIFGAFKKSLVAID